MRHAQPYVETVKHRNLTIDLGNGLKTNAQLTFPAVGKGPFPGVLLIPGGGGADMNYSGGYTHIDKETGSKDISTYRVPSNCRIPFRKRIRSASIR